MDKSNSFELVRGESYINVYTNIIKMSTTLVVILFAIGAVGLFVLGMSLTLIFKGHNIKSEIGENENMRSRGIKCVIQEAREQEGLDGEGCISPEDCEQAGCSSCGIAGQAKK